jgi:hypothetical protein
MLRCKVCKNRGARRIYVYVERRCLQHNTAGEGFSAADT